MSSRRLTGLVAAAGLLLVGACDQQPTQQQIAPTDGSPQFSMHTTCQPTGTGLTAKVVNEDVVNETIDVADCDVGAFFDEDGVVRNATFLQDDAGGPDEQHAIRVAGARVDVVGSEIEVVDDFANRFIAIAYRDGATGRIAGNTITGFHRAGILLDGAGTEATVSRNEVIGVGPKTTGWAENGIQISSGATGTVKRNEVRDHWWDLNNFLSSGIIIAASDDVTVHHNTLSGNDGSLTIQDASSANFVQNTVDTTDPDGATSGLFHAGAVVYSGTNVGFRHNEFTSGSSAGSANVGLYLVPETLLTGPTVNTKLIGNTFDGFSTAIVDQGDETKLPKPFVPN